MTDLLRSVVTVIDVFYKYTKQDEECGTLSKDELKELLEKEFRPILKNPDDPDTVDVIMHMLDRDHDRRLDFTEFLLMVFKLALACNKVLGKEYCKASGSKKRRHGHQHQEEESETEEDEEDTPGRKSGYRHSSWSEGEKHGYSSGDWRGTVKRRHGSNSRRLGRQGNLSSSGNQERSEKRHHRSSSGHSWSSGKERHGSSSGELGERINKSHVSPSRESGEEYESGCGSKSWGRKGHGGVSCGLETSQHESNSTQSRSRGQNTTTCGGGDKGKSQNQVYQEVSEYTVRMWAINREEALRRGVTMERKEQTQVPSA
uniref:EF-hand domain-containing protein n=1 Tax=Saimiri boliviensis boliviensis TaxID=39432 RepID=A0A2K6UXX4_SAIBB